MNNNSSSRQFPFAVTFGLTAAMGAIVSGCGGGGGTAPNTNSVSAPPSFTIGGTVSGLGGDRVTLRNNGVDLVVTASGNFRFANQQSTGTAFDVSVVGQPSNPAQVCSVASGSGTVANADIANIAVSCVTNSYTIGGTVSGLVGSQLVIRDSNGARLSVTGNGVFTFPTPRANGSSFAVSVQNPPVVPSQTCTIANATGDVGSTNNADNAVTCTTNRFSVGGTVAGLAGSGSGLSLRINNANTLAVSHDGSFGFEGIVSGSVYSIAVDSQPTSPWQTCIVTNGTGAVSDASILNVAVNCTTNSYNVGGTVNDILPGSSVVLSINGVTQTFSADAPFTFTTKVQSGTSYAVTVFSQPTTPRQRCTIPSGGNGTITNTSVTNVFVWCESVYAVGGTVSGLVGSGLKLRNNGGDDLIITSNGAFTFATTWSRLSPYDVTIATSPNTPPQSCQITHGSGALTRDENTVRVDCDTDRFAYVANAADNSVTEFSIDSLTGKLKAVQGATFPTGTGPRAIVSDPLRRFIYVANFDSNSISGYVVNDTTGALTPVAGSPFFAGTNPSALAIDSEGMFLYAANYGSNSISGFTIQSNGSLASITGSPFATGLGPKSLATTPAQQCCSLYVANSLGNTVSAFAYDSDTGVLSSQPGSPYATGTTPTSVFVNRTAEFVFVANYDSNTVSMFDLQGGIGSLVERAVSPIATGITPCALGPAPGAFSVVYRATSGVSVFDYDYTDFTQPPVEIGPATPAGAGACSFVVPITSPYVYVVNEIANTISAFYWKYNYTPVESIGTYDVGNNPRAIAIRNNVADLDALGIPH